MEHVNDTVREECNKYGRRTVEGLGRQLRKVKSSGKQPLPNGYWPELEQINDMSPELASHYLQLIWILSWGVEIGRIEIFMEVAVMSQYSVSP